MLRGRTFADDEGAPGRETAVVNRRFVELYFPGQDAIGRRIRLTAPRAPGDAAPPWLTIVGVSPTVRQRAASSDEAVVYTPYRAAPLAQVAVVLRSATDAAAALDALRREAAALDPDLPVFAEKSVKQVLDQAQSNGRVSHGLVVAITTVAFVLALFGLYTVIAHGVAQRAHGDRHPHGPGRAFAAHPRRGRQGRAALHLAGTVDGYRVHGRVGRRFLQRPAGLRLIDWRVLMPASAFLGAVALAASLGPALRASRLNPMSVIRDAD